jgi:hypothetical protein
MLFRCAIVLFLVQGACYADDLPLFASEEPLAIVFEFPVDIIVRQADDRPVVEGSVHYTDEKGKPVSVGMTMTTRGKSRLETCKFPPISVNFRKQERADTVLAGQKKLKLVTHCRDGDTYARYLLQEYAIYRAFNVLTDSSFRVRLVNATYRDSVGKRKDKQATAFFLESEDELADRLGMEKRDSSVIDPPQLDPVHLSLYSLFQYLIANTDWSVLKGPGDDACCHNGKVVTPPGSMNGWRVIPYDFDQAGIINTKYALPAEQLGLKSVRQRLYRGRCSHGDQLDATIALFNARRTEIEAALLPDSLPARYRSSTLGYIDDFYQVINDPLKREKNIENRCLGG